jgi:hypothetical protein
LGRGGKARKASRNNYKIVVDKQIKNLYRSYYRGLSENVMLGIYLVHNPMSHLGLLAF